MNRDNYRTIGSVAGLALGIGLMLMLGLSGIIPGAIFGASGCVAGAVAAEKLHARNNRGGS